MNDRPRLAATPGTRLRAVAAALTLLCLPLVGGAQGGGGASFDHTAPRVLAAPPLAAKFAVTSRPEPRTRLLKVSERRNQVTDDAEWFTRNRLKRPEGGSQAPASYAEKDLIRAIPASTGDILLYGREYSADVVAVRNASGGLRYALDFSSFQARKAGGEDAGEALTLPVVWASNSGDTLYVQNAYNGYAREVSGRTSYLSAWDGKAGRLLWKSVPLVGNAKTFAVVGDVIVSGYGFTDEKDFVFVLDRNTGKVLQTIRVRSGPEYIVTKGDQVYVRCYDTDYVFRVTDR